MYRDPSAAPLLDLRRGLKAVMDVLNAMIRDGFRWHGWWSSRPSGMKSSGWGLSILLLGRIFSRLGVVVLASLVVLLGIFIVSFLISSMGSLCVIHSVVHRRDEAIRGWRNWLREDPLVHPHKWLRPDLVPPQLHFSCVSPILRLVVLGFLPILLGLMRNSEKPGFPIVVAPGKGRPALRNPLMGSTAGCPCFQRYLCLSLLGGAC